MQLTDYNAIIKELGIHSDDIVFISSDVTQWAASCYAAGELFDANLFLNMLIDMVSPDGTILLPTYNWDFCSGKAFDYKKTPSKTGSLTKAALKRKDFKRTKHPIYSFAVWGKDQKTLCGLENTDSFGSDSVFAYLHHNNAKNLIIDVSLQHCFTFVHYVEECVGNLPYRYLKSFTADYIDENGNRDQRTYTMFVRDLDKNVKVTIDPMMNIFREFNVVTQVHVDEIPFTLLELGKVYPLLEYDIVYNKSRHLTTYDGQ